MWNWILEHIEISFDVVAIAIIASGFAIAFHRKIVLPIIRGAKKFGDTKFKIDKIYSELSPNGGASIRDAVNRIEIRLVAVEQRQNLYLMESPQGIFETDASGRVISVNRTYCRMTGRTERELFGMNWVNAILPEDRDRVMTNWESSVEECMEFICKFNMIHSDNQIFTVSTIAYPMENQVTGEIIGWMGTVNKISPVDNEDEFIPEFK